MKAPSVGRAVRLLLGGVFILQTAACDDARDDVARWLACDECQGELQAVTSEGNDALEPLLVALYRGASWPQQQNFVAQAREEYRLAARAKAALPAGVSTLSDGDDYVSDGLADLLTTQRLRAAWALRALDTPEARDALRQAALDDSSGFTGWPDDVSQLVARLDAADPITTVSVHTQVRGLAIGDSTQLSAQAHGPMTVPQAFVWSSSHPAVMTVSAAGIARRLTSAHGPVTVRACAASNASVCGAVVIGMP